MGRVSSSLPVCSSAVLGIHPYAFVFPGFRQGESSGGGDPFSCREGWDGACSSSFWFLQPVIRGVWKTSGSWRPVIDLSLLNRSFSKTPFKMETLAFVLLRPQGGLLAGSRPSGQPQASEVCDLQQGVPVSCALLQPLAPTTGVHQGYGSCLLDSPRFRYMDDWLIQASSWEDVLRLLETVLSLCLELGIVVNPAKFNFVSAQRAQYLSTILDSLSFRAPPSQQSREASDCSLLLPGRSSSGFSPPSFISFCAVASTWGRSS